MLIDVEFLDAEPIENVITCLNYQIDKTIFFGYQETIDKYKNNTEQFLRGTCHVKEVTFFQVPKDDASSIADIMRSVIKNELTEQNEMFFDLTGGEGLVLVVFGMIANEYNLPMHLYNIPDNKLIEINGKHLSKKVPQREISFDLDRYIGLYGGKINYYLQKTMKFAASVDTTDDVNRLWKVAAKHWKHWNMFSDFLRSHMAPAGDKDLSVSKGARSVIDAIRTSSSERFTIRVLNDILDDLAENKLLTDVIHEDGKYHFTFKTEMIKACIWEGGSVLELHTYLQEVEQNRDCRIGVYLDWDGILHLKRGIDVVNEVDVLSLKGCLPTFISCKSGKLEGVQALHALYELDTVSRRFGGKYAKKVLVTGNELKPVYMERAEEMEIEVRVCNI